MNIGSSISRCHERSSYHRTAVSVGHVGLGLGESEAERDADQTLDVIGGQLDGSLPDAVDAENTVIAYEPIWAIGTGKVPSIAQIEEVHDFMRARLTDRFGAEIGNALPLLYGGSVKPDNAAEIFAVENVDGALVGGASLKAADFGGIVDALDNGTDPACPGHVMRNHR